MELRDLLNIARRWLWLFVLATAVAAAGAWIATRFMPTTYSSSSTLLVGSSVSDPDPNGMSLYLSQQLATSYSQMATRQGVLTKAVEILSEQAELPEAFDYRRLQGMVAANVIPGQQLIEVRTIDTDPIRAQLVASAVSEALVNESPTTSQRELVADEDFVRGRIERLRANIEEAEIELGNLELQMENETSARGIAEINTRRQALNEQINTWETRYAQLRIGLEGSEVNRLSVIEEAQPGTPVGPNVMMNVLLAAAIGFGLALAAVMFLEYLDDTVKTTEDLERRLDLAGLGTIERLPDVSSRGESLVTLRAPRSPHAEAYRVLRTNLQFALVDSPDASVVITSANPGEGKSTTTANLGVVCAQSGRDVILVDADLRRPSLHKIFGMTNNVGLSTLVIDESADPASVLREVEGVPGLKILTSGPLPPNPTEMLESARMKAVIDDLHERAALVLYDTPPVLVVADAAVMAQRVEGTVLVSDSGATRVEAARRSVETLAKVGITPLGAVINRLDREKVGKYYGYYRYSYQYQYGYDDYYGGGGDGEGGGGTPPAGPGGSGAEKSGRPVGVLQRLRQGFLSLLS